MATTKKKTNQKAASKSAAPKKAAPKKATAKPAAKSGGKTASYRINAGDKMPSFSGPTTSGGKLVSGDLKGRLAVLYFYPKDNTPGCTLEGHDFRKRFGDFKKLGCEIIGVSKDSVRSHEGFKEKCGFPFELLSDEDESVCRAFDVIQMKSLYGRKFEGIERSTFLITPDGKIAHAWRKVKVDGHVDQVLERAKELVRA